MSPIYTSTFGHNYPTLQRGLSAMAELLVSYHTDFCTASTSRLDCARPGTKPVSLPSVRLLSRRDGTTASQSRHHSLPPHSDTPLSPQHYHRTNLFVLFRRPSCRRHASSLSTGNHSASLSHARCTWRSNSAPQVLGAGQLNVEAHMPLSRYYRVSSRFQLAPT